jgi:lipopolysaccharide export system protein LptA
MRRKRHAGTTPAEPARVRARCAVACCALALLCAAGAYAAKPDREEPIHLEADRVTIDDAKQTALFEGRVVLTQGTLEIRGDRMQVRQDKEGFSHGITWGELAHFRQKREGEDEYIEGWAERIEYDGRTETVKLFNRARMLRGQDEVRGHYISYNAATSRYEVVGGGPQAATAANPEGRVRAVIQPKPRAGAPRTPPAGIEPSR